MSMTSNGYDSSVASEIIASFDAKPELLVQILHQFLERFTSQRLDANRDVLQILAALLRGNDDFLDRDVRVDGAVRFEKVSRITHD